MGDEKKKKKKEDDGIFGMPSYDGPLKPNGPVDFINREDFKSLSERQGGAPTYGEETDREKWDKIGRRQNVEEAEKNESGPNQEEKKSLLRESRGGSFTPLSPNNYHPAARAISSIEGVEGFIEGIDNPAPIDPSDAAGEPAPAMTYETPEEVSQSLSIYPKQATPEATEKWSNLLKATRDAVPTPNARLLDGVEGGISAADRAPPAPPTEPTGASSKEEATQRVMYENNYGTGLGALKAMEDDKYELGSGSSLSEPARPIGPESGKYRRAARRLRRQGYGAAANQMAMDGERVRAGEPAIDTEELRAQRASMKMLVGRETQKQDQKMADLDERDAAFQKKKKEDEEEEAKKNENNRLASYAVNAAGIGNLV